jgi:RNA polymerase sigma-70 factor (ECF subfamily)
MTKTTHQLPICHEASNPDKSRAFSSAQSNRSRDREERHAHDEEELPRVYGYVAYQVASHEEAEDLTQQTFERALAHWCEFDHRRATITTWLLAIARNLVVDHYGARSRRPPTVSLEDLSDPQLDSAGYTDPVLGLDAELESALSVLGERERELIALRYGADLSGPQIASVTGLSVANVQQILSRSLRRLRAELERTSRRRRRIGPVENERAHG